MAIRKFALFGGLAMLAMLVICVLSLIPALSSSNGHLPALKVLDSSGMFLGIFPMNILNKAALLVFGGAGIIAARRENLNASIGYARVVAIFMGIMAVLGFIPSMNTFYGYLPLYGGEVVAHGAFAIAGAYYGYAVPARLMNRQMHV